MGVNSSGHSPFKHIIGRKPFCIGPDHDVYLRRWWVIPKNKWFNIYLHNFFRSDDDRALHDHPWWNVSILLRGEYKEHTRQRIYLRRAPVVVFRSAVCAHRIELTTNGGSVWTLFITGPKIRDWGFLCPNGWRHWSKFVSLRAGGNDIGPGCE